MHGIYIPEMALDIEGEAKRLKSVMDKQGNVNLFISEGAGLDSVIAEMTARGGQGVVALIDLDRFKEVNDSLGHQRGDLLLAVLGARLAAEVDATSGVCAAVRELFRGMSKGDHLIVLRPDQEVTPAGAADLLGVTRQFVDRLLADGVLEFRRLPDSKHRRIKVGDVLALAEERDRRRQGSDAIRSALSQHAIRG